MPPRTKARRRYKRRLYKKGYKRRSTKASRSFVKKVQKIIHKNAETKQAFTGISNVSFNSGVTSVADNYRIFPQINQGTADNARIGDQIRAQKLTVKGCIVYDPSTGDYGSYANTRLAVRMMVVMPKNLRDYASVDGAYSSWQNILLKKGGTTSQFTGVVSDLWAPINTDAITKYYDKVFYIQGTYQATAAGSTQLLGSTKFFSKTFKYRNKLIRYDNAVGSGLIPSNFAPTLILGYVHLNGGSPDVLTTAIKVSYDAILDYEDV